jgi:MFS family permease
MTSDEIPEFREPPPEGHPIGVYAGLLIGGIILGIGAVVLFREFLITISKGGLTFTSQNIVQATLMILSAFSSFACFLAFIRIFTLQREMAKKVSKEFKDFITYARPLVEEVMRQRMVGEQLLQELEKLHNAIILGEEKYSWKKETALMAKITRWEEFLLFVAVLTSMTLGLFVYLERHPWELVPYSIIFLAIAWWVIIARFFGIIFDTRSYYIPALFILVVPSLSIILRAFMEPYQAVYVVFILLFFYIVGMYTYFNYLTTGSVPRIILRGRGGFREGRVPPPLRGYLPPWEPPKSHGAAIIKRVKNIFPVRNQKEKG